MKNLANEPEHAKLMKSLKKKLAEWCKQQGDTLGLEHLAGVSGRK